MSVREMTAKYKTWILKIKYKLVALQAEYDKQLYLSLYGDSMQKRNAKTALKGIRQNIREQKNALKVKLFDSENQYTNHKIEKFWNPSWKTFLSPVTF